MTIDLKTLKSKYIFKGPSLRNCLQIINEYIHYSEYTHILTHTHTYTHTHTHIYTHIHTHTYTNIHRHTQTLTTTFYDYKSGSQY